MSAASLYELSFSVPWLITEEALEAMRSIAARDPLPADEIARRLHGPKALARRQGQHREDSGRMTMHGSVALIPIDGPIYRYADFFTQVSGGVTTEALARDFGLAMDDPSVSAVLLVIDSPGGEATSINEFADAIYAARGKKPIVAYIEGYGASAAYWIASAADVVVVDDTALVGSIGTVMGVPDPTKRVSRTIDFVSTQSPRKRPDPMSDAGRSYLQSLVDELTEVFITKVARNRHLETSAILAIEGGLLIGQAAVDAGLADAVGSEEGALRMLQEGRALTALRRPMFTRQPQEESFMSGKSFWSGFWSGAREAGVVPVAEETIEVESLQPVTAELVRPEPSAAALAAEAENARLRAELAKLRAARVQADAQAFVSEQIGSGHAYPAESAALNALYVQAATDDAERPLDGGATRVGLLQAAITGRPAHRLDANLVPSRVQGIVLGNRGGVDEEEAQADASAREYAKRANGQKAR